VSVVNEQDAMKNVVVTGARGSLGREVVDIFLNAGCRVFGVDRQDPQELISDPERPNLLWIGADLSDPSSVETLFEVLASQGTVDCLIHCAGGFRFSFAHEISDEDVSFLVNANLLSSIFVARNAMRLMRQQEFGRLVFISSATTLRPGAGTSAYAATKAAINTFVESVAAEVKGHDINIHVVLPSIIDTPSNREDMPGADFRKWVRPNQLAEVIFSLTQPTFDPVRSCLLPVTAGV